MLSNLTIFIFFLRFEDQNQANLIPLHHDYGHGYFVSAFVIHAHNTQLITTITIISTIATNVITTHFWNKNLHKLVFFLLHDFYIQ